jgi:sugar/nucleoside kinase (ribokinase family)
LLRETAPNIDWLSRPATRSTTFGNTYVSGGRTQRVYDRAPRLTSRDVGVIPVDVRIFHIAPVLREIGPAFFGEVATNRFVALTAQGLLRKVNDDGFVSTVVSRSARAAFERADISVVSAEDFDGDVAKACELLGRSRVGVLTDGHRPIRAHESGRWFKFPVVFRPIRNPTGTGDVFAAALFVRYEATGNLEESLRFSATAAADWITARDSGLSVMSPSRLAEGE